MASDAVHIESNCHCQISEDGRSKSFIIFNHKMSKKASKKKKTRISEWLFSNFHFLQGYPYNWPRIIYEDWNRFRSSTINGANGLRTLYTIHGKDIVLKDPRFSPDINCTSDKVWSRNGINQFVNGPVFHGVRLNMSMFDEFLTPKPRPTSAPFQSVPNVIDWEKYFSQRIPWHPAGDQYGSNVWFPGSNVIVYTPPRFEVLMPLVDDPMTFPTMMMPSYQEQLAQFSGIYKWGLDNG